MPYKLYTLDNQFIKETDDYPINFTGIIVYVSGTKSWFVDGKCHRLDGPASEYANGSKSWFVNGKYHRIDGPAYEDSVGGKRWFVNNKEITEEQCKLLHSVMKLKNLI